MHPFVNIELALQFSRKNIKNAITISNKLNNMFNTL